jgi:hypothetical protein
MQEADRQILSSEHDLTATETQHLPYVLARWAKSINNCVSFRCFTPNFSSLFITSRLPMVDRNTPQNVQLLQPWLTLRRNVIAREMKQKKKKDISHYVTKTQLLKGSTLLLDQVQCSAVLVTWMRSYISSTFYTLTQCMSLFTEITFLSFWQQCSISTNISNSPYIRCSSYLLHAMQQVQNKFCAIRGYECLLSHTFCSRLH